MQRNGASGFSQRVLCIVHSLRPRLQCEYSMRRTYFALILAILTSSIAQNAPIDVQILAFNDFHGNLKSPGKISGIDAGGAEYLATWIQTLKSGHPNNVVVAAGDLIGASPLLSSMFHDEPTIESLNLMGLEFTSVGNHEFDEGKTELLRMQNGGCHPVDGCKADARFTGATFKYLAANVVDTARKPLFPAYQVKSFSGIPVAFIGLTLRGTPGIVSPAGVAGLTFEDEADTVNRLVPELKAQGIEAIVVLIHQGGKQEGAINECREFSGTIADIVRRMSKSVDVVISGHTHEAYNCTIDGRLVTSASSFGRVLTTIDLKLDTKTHDVVSIKAENHIVRDDVAKDPEQTALIRRIAPLVEPIENRVIGSATATLDSIATTAGESSLGDIIADAELEGTRATTAGGAQIAFINSGGIRSAIVPINGKVTYGQIFTTQPFGDTMVTMSLLGSEIHALLEQQWKGNGTAGTVLQVSTGFTYAWDAANPAGRRVDPAGIKLNGVTLNPAARYRITVNDFLSTGGDGFTVLKKGTNKIVGMTDLEVLEQYFKAHSPVAPGPRNRIRRTH